MLRSFWIQPDGTTEIHELEGMPRYDDDVWKQAKEFIGGYFEFVHVLFNGERCDMIVDEDGIMKQLPVNAVATEIYYAASRARGVEPTCDASREADSQAQLERLAAGLKIDPKNIRTFNLGPPGAPKIYGPAIVFEGQFD